MMDCEKYNLAQEVWYLDFANREIKSSIIVAHEWVYFRKYEEHNLSRIAIMGNGDNICELYLYPSRDALIESQIEYWSCLKNQEKSTCSDEVSMSPTFEGEIRGF